MDDVITISIIMFEHCKIQEILCLSTTDKREKKIWYQSRRKYTAAYLTN